MVIILNNVKTQNPLDSLSGVTAMYWFVTLSVARSVSVELTQHVVQRLDNVFMSHNLLKMLSL